MSLLKIKNKKREQFNGSNLFSDVSNTTITDNSVPSSSINDMLGGTNTSSSTSTNDIFSSLPSSSTPGVDDIKISSYQPHQKKLTDQELLQQCCNNEEDYNNIYKMECQSYQHSYYDNVCQNYRGNNLLKENSEYIKQYRNNNPNLNKSDIEFYCKDKFLSDEDCMKYCRHDSNNCETLYKDYCIKGGNYEQELECQTHTKTNDHIKQCCTNEYHPDYQEYEDCGEYNYNTGFCNDNRINYAFESSENENSQRILNDYCRQNNNFLNEDRCKTYCSRENQPCKEIQKEYCENPTNLQEQYCKDVCKNANLSKIPPHLSNSNEDPLWKLCHQQVEENTDIIRKGMESLIQFTTGIIELHYDENKIYDLSAEKKFIQLDSSLDLLYYDEHSEIYLSCYIKPPKTKLYHFVSEIGPNMTVDLWIDNTQIEYSEINNEQSIKKQYLRLKENTWYPIRIKLNSDLIRTGSTLKIYTFKLFWGIKETGQNFINNNSFGIIDSEASRRAITNNLLILSQIQYPLYVRSKVLIKSYKTREIKGLPVKKELIEQINIQNYNPNNLIENYSIELIFFLLPTYNEEYTIFLEHNKDHNTEIFINDIQQILEEYEHGSKFKFLFNANIAYRIKITQNIDYGQQSLILKWESNSQLHRVIQSEALAVVQLDADTLIEPAPIPKYQKDYINNDNCCLNEGDSNLCEAGFKKNNQQCISQLSNYCINSNMNDKCVSYCKEIDSNCDVINYEYCKRNVNAPLCDNLCQTRNDEQFQDDVCRNTTQYLTSVADLVASDLIIEKKRVETKEMTERKEQIKLIMSRNVEYSQKSKQQQEIRNTLYYTVVNNTINKMEYTYNNRQFLDDINLIYNLSSEGLKNLREKNVLNQNHLNKTHQIIKESLQNIQTKNKANNILRDINKTKVLDILSKTNNIESKLISEKTGIPLNEVNSLRAEIIYDDNNHGIFKPDDYTEYHEKIINESPILKNNNITYQEIMDDIKKHRDNILFIEYTKEFTNYIYEILPFIIDDAVKDKLESKDKSVFDNEFEQEIIDTILQTELNVIETGLSDATNYKIYTEVIIKADVAKEEKREEYEQLYSMKFPDEPEYANRSLQDDLEILIPVILINPDDSLLQISNKTNIPLDRIYNLEFDIIKKLDNTVDYDILKTSNEDHKKQKEIIFKKFRINLMKKFHKFDIPTNLAQEHTTFGIKTDYFMMLFLFIIFLLTTIGLYKFNFSSSKKQKDISNTIPIQTSYQNIKNF